MDNILFENLKKYSDTDKSLRDYQRDNKQKVYEAWENCQSVMLQMPTGTGKTRVFASIIKDIRYYSEEAKRAFKVLVLVHRKELVDQIDEELGYRYGLAHGIIQSGDRERKKYPIQIASVQTLIKRLDNWTDKEFDFIIIDEAHHTTAESYQKIIKAFPHAKLLGVTATPCRLSGEGFTGTFEKLILSPTVKQFIDDGYLCQYDYYSVAKSSFIQKEIDGIKKFSNGDYAEQEMERICNNDRIRAQVVETYLKYANGKKGIVYTINKTHNRNLCEEFCGKGIEAVAMDSSTPKDIREKNIEDFKNGKIRIICNVNLFTEGFDCPDIEFIQLARPTRSLTLYLQQVGRGLRISENKEKTLFLDNVGLYNKFGFPSSHRHWMLHFEGKTSRDESDKKPRKDNTDIEITKRTRKQNLDEGNEKVHLIQTSLDDEVEDIRKMSFLDLLNHYNDIYVNACDLLWEKYSKLGLFIKNQKIGCFHEIYSTEIIGETDEFCKVLANDEFEFEEGGNKKKRKCKNAEELKLALYREFQEERRGLMGNHFKFLMHQLKTTELKQDEIKHFVVSCPNWKPSAKPRLLRGELWGIRGASFFLYADLGIYTKKKSEHSILINILMALIELQDKEIKSHEKEIEPLKI